MNHWERTLVPTCALGEPERFFKLVICEVGHAGGGRSIVWDQAGNLHRAGEEPGADRLVIKLNEANPALGELSPPHAPSDRRPRLRVAFGVNGERWLCATVEDLLTKIILVALLVCGTFATMHARQKAELVWQQVARELGLELTSSGDQRSMFGEVHGVGVRADYVRRTRVVGKGVRVEEKVTFVASGEESIPPNLAVGRERFLSRFVNGEDESSGDKDFDDLIDLRNMDASICAALSDAGRQHLVAFVELGGQVQGSVLTCEREGDQYGECAPLVQMLQWLPRVVQELTVTGATLHERLARAMRCTIRCRAFDCRTSAF